MRPFVLAACALLFARCLGAAGIVGIPFHAERFVGNAKVVPDETAFAGKAVRGTRWYYFCKDIPFPQGEGEYHVYLRLKSEGKANPIQLGALRGKDLTILAAAPSPEPGRWTWVNFQPLRAEAVGASLVIHGGGNESSQWTLLDGMVISRETSLSSESLDSTMRTGGLSAGILAAPKTASPPVIDGVLDDAFYGAAPEAFPFARLGQPRFADAQTRASVLWDDSNLFVAARLDDPVLDPAANRLGDFRRKVTQHDGPVWSDDCLEVFIDPTCEGRDYYQFVVNPLGTVYDAHGQDAKFESGAVAKASVADGCWAVELSIPLKSMGMSSPTRGTAIGMNFGRERYGEKELSTWTPLTRFAQVEEYGRVVLTDGNTGRVALAADGRKLDLFRFGENKLSFSGAGNRALTAFVEARTERAKPLRATASGKLGEGAPPVELKYQLAESGRATVQFLVMDSETAMPLYRSPLYAGEVSGSIAQVTLKSDGNLSVFCNGEPVAAGGQEVSARIPLVDGLNAFAVKTSGATLSGLVKAGTFEAPVDATWRWTPDAGALSRDLDLDPLQKTVADGAAIRAPSPGGVFRKSIAINASRSWPNYGDALCLAQGAAQWFHIRLKGIRGLSVVKKPVILVNAPEGVEVVDAAGYYGKKRPQQPRFTREERGSLTIEGKTYHRTAFRSDLPMRTLEQTGILNLFSVTIRTTARRPGDQAELYFHLNACDGALAEKPQRLSIRITEPLQGKQPRAITLQCWPGWMSTYDADAGREALLKTIAQAGFNDVVLGDGAADARRHGMRCTALINFESWLINLAPYIKDHPGHALMDSKGKPSTKFICTTCLLGNAWEDYVAPEIGKWLAKNPVHHVNWDYESSAYTGYLVCYDDRCLTAFRKYAGLAADAQLTPDSIKKDHGQPWLDFMATQSSKVARRFHDSIKQSRSQTIFSMYSGYQGPDTLVTYNVDWRLCAPHLDLVMCGYGRRVEEVAATRQAAGKTPCVFGCITYPYEYDDDSATSVITAAEVLRRLCDARGGVLYYSLSNGDARTFLSFAKVSRVAAAFEDFFAKGQEDRSGFEVTSGNESDTYVFSLGKRRLLCLVNETAKPVHFDVECPVAGREFLTGQPFPAGSLSVDVPPGDVAVFSFGE